MFNVTHSDFSILYLFNVTHSGFSILYFERVYPIKQRSIYDVNFHRRNGDLQVHRFGVSMESSSLVTTTRLHRIGDRRRDTVGVLVFGKGVQFLYGTKNEGEKEKSI